MPRQKGGKTRRERRLIGRDLKFSRLPLHITYHIIYKNATKPCNVYSSVTFSAGYSIFVLSLNAYLAANASSGTTSHRSPNSVLLPSARLETCGSRIAYRLSVTSIVFGSASPFLRLSLNVRMNST